MFMVFLKGFQNNPFLKQPSHSLGMNYCVNFLGGISSNGFHIRHPGQWRPGIGVNVTQRHCVFKPIT